MDSKIHEKLLAPFEDSDIEWRLQWVNDEKTNGIAVPYITNRAIQYRLDETVGFDKWKNEYIPWHSDGKKASQICGISIYDTERNDWLTKYDGAENSDIEPIKGGLSDSMKRAAVQWGIGRYLYGMETVYVKVEARGKTPCIVKSEYSKLNSAHQTHVARITGKQSEAKNSVILPLPKSQSLPSSKPETKLSQPQQSLSEPRELPKTAMSGKTADTPVWVVRVAESPTLTGQPNTSLQLRDVAGKTVDVLVKGTDPRLVAGTMLIKTEFSKLERQGVLFYILDNYEVAQQYAA